MIRLFTCIAILFSMASSSSADIHLSEHSSPAYSLINPRIAALATPATPHDIPVAEFGLHVIGWGVGADGARHRMESLDSRDVDQIKQAGTTLDMVRAWQIFYENETVRNLGNPAAKYRARLMKKIAELW